MDSTIDPKFLTTRSSPEAALVTLTTLAVDTDTIEFSDVPYMPTTATEDWNEDAIIYDSIEDADYSFLDFLETSTETIFEDEDATIYDSAEDADNLFPRTSSPQSEFELQASSILIETSTETIPEYDDERDFKLNDWVTIPDGFYDDTSNMLMVTVAILGPIPIENTQT